MFPDTYKHCIFNIRKCTPLLSQQLNAVLHVSVSTYKRGSTVKAIFALHYHYIIAFTDYVEDIYQTYLSSSKDELSDAVSKLQNMTPAPMNTMLEKQSREEAIAKRAKRAKIVVEDVPPTSTPGMLNINLYTK